MQWVTGHLLHHEPPVCAVGDHLLPDSKKEKVEEPPQPTQQELIVKASQEAGTPTTIDIGQCFTTGKWFAPPSKDFARPRLEDPGH